MSSWLNKLRSTELHRLAVLLGTPCSGTKTVKIQGIKDILSQTRATAADSNTRVHDAGIRLLSIDMGVKNLAYAYLTVPTRPKVPSTSTSSCTLEEWRKFDIAAPASPVDAPTAIHAYHPATYAARAFSFVQSILKYSPTHIIIERQRFRSAGGPAVQEWSIRVGVFEAMLWSVLYTLQHSNTSNSVSPELEGVLPARVNRFWFDRVAPATQDTDTAPTKLSGRDMKKAKIKLVTSLLESEQEAHNREHHYRLELGHTQSLRDQVSLFKGSTLKAKGTTKMVSTAKLDKLDKLDDLADCLLQGLAWLSWRNNRIKVIDQGQDAFNLKD